MGKDPKSLDKLRESVNLATFLAEYATATPTVQAGTINELCTSIIKTMRTAIKEEANAISSPSWKPSSNSQGSNYHLNTWRNNRPQMRSNRPNGAGEQRKCRGCGKSCRDRSKCPAFNVRCHKCSIWRHFAYVCEQPTRQNQSQNFTPRE